ncbi:Phage integrase family protein [Hyphomicrobium facile]|uniref:Phage integrase family protein n=2 Tax=Hyphomicrobium facile TaxID=51670 RepID=A0A1I7NE16_9HYPH|nr:Phage integrase family protein [Hyphomicrobium facile]
MGRKRLARQSLPAHVHTTRMRGKEYYALHPHRGTKRAGKRVPLPGCPYLPDGTPNPEWWSSYRSAAEAIGLLHRSSTPRPGTIAAAIAGYMESPDWRISLKPGPRKEYARHLRYVSAVWGELALAGIETKHVMELRDSRADTPPDANNLVIALSSLMKWSVLRGLRATNPCRDVPKFKGGEGYAPWPWEAIEHFRQHARRELADAADLALYTGQRQGDVLAMSWRDYTGDLICVKQAKTSKSLRLAVHRDLQAVLERLLERTGSTLAELRLSNARILLNSRGLPWKTGFKASWQAQFNRPIMASLRERELVFHGLRKSAVVFLLEAGATTAEVQAITGQSMQMVEHYARQVNQKKLARSAILKWESASRDEA